MQFEYFWLIRYFDVRPKQHYINVKNYIALLLGCQFLVFVYCFHAKNWLFICSFRPSGTATLTLMSNFKSIFKFHVNIRIGSNETWKRQNKRFPLKKFHMKLYFTKIGIMSDAENVSRFLARVMIQYKLLGPKFLFRKQESRLLFNPC